ncbi:MAG TPA: type II toxin-antitoxin system prevent-host-death family antitoxin [Polyangia bacterium]|nr:type II toxin-antitoxin system prevent-host-death family antitoxin [Polyangia bacterium]
MDASAVRSAFASVLEAVRQKAEAVVVVRYGRPVAALVPIDRLHPHERLALEDDGGSGAKREDGPG